jgi:hypothetical protein
VRLSCCLFAAAAAFFLSAVAAVRFTYYEECMSVICAAKLEWLLPVTSTSPQKSVYFDIEVAVHCCMLQIIFVRCVYVYGSWHVVSVITCYVGNMTDVTLNIVVPQQG